MVKKAESSPVIFQEMVSSSGSVPEKVLNSVPPGLFSGTPAGCRLLPEPITGGSLMRVVADPLDDQLPAPSSLTARTCTSYSVSASSPVMVLLVVGPVPAWSVQFPDPLVPYRTL